MKAIMRDDREMKDSGIDWIGKIPNCWRTARLKDISEIQTGSTPDKKFQAEYYSLEDGVPWIKAENLGRPNPICTTKEYLTKNGCDVGRVFPANTVYVCCIASIGKVGYSTIPCSCNQQINGIIFDNKYIDYKFGYYLSIAQEEEYILRASGNVLKILNAQQQSYIPCVIPLLNEQQLIADYLDDRCSKIDAIIAEAKASIEEYKELKQAVITQAVTLGIKKNRPLKDTNILWIGKTPCDWQVAELKFFASIKSGITLGQKYPARAKLVEMPYLRVANVQGEYVDLSDVKTIQVLPEEVDKYRLEAGVVLMTEGGDRDKLGRGCVWHGEIDPCLHQNHVFAVTTKADKLLPEYFSHVTTSEVARCYFDYTAKKTTNLANTNSSTIMNFRLPIPPLEEQREIVQYLNKRIKKLNDMISEKQSLIEDLETYKKSLIYEVVTGKRKVVA